MHCHTLHGLSGSWKRSGEAQQSPLVPKSTSSISPANSVLYGCDSWILSTSMASKINAFATSCYRIMLNITCKCLNRVTNAKVYQMTDSQPLITTVRQRQLRSLGHILRRPEGEPCRRYALFTPISW